MAQMISLSQARSEVSGLCMYGWSRGEKRVDQGRAQYIQ